VAHSCSTSYAIWPISFPALKTVTGPSSDTFSDKPKMLAFHAAVDRAPGNRNSRVFPERDNAA
jgi:hypothetical protein